MQAVVEAAHSVADAAKNVAEGAEEFVEEMTNTSDDDEKGTAKDPSTSTAMSLEDRKKKLNELRNRMVWLALFVLWYPLTQIIFYPIQQQHDSAQKNRSEVVSEATKLKVTAREAARREKQLKLAETLRLKTEAEERGEDLERKKNWEYTIEENDEWEKKKRRKERNADFEFHGTSTSGINEGFAV